MNTDALHRRRRTAKPQPRGKFIRLDDSDLDVFEAIHRHGHLPTHYLFEYTDKKNFNSFQHRLTRLFNGTENGEHYLVRPEKQWESLDANYQYTVYDLHLNAQMLLSSKGRFSPHIQRGDPFVHRLMGACVGASIELACKTLGLKYVSRHDVLNRKGNAMKLPLAHNWLVPDEVFGIGYGDSHRFFAVEIDRATEPIHRKSLEQTDFGKKLVAYLEVMRNRTYKEEWDIPGMVVLTVTTNETRAKSLMEEVRKLDPVLSKRYLFKVVEHFGTPWRIPPVLSDILEPWDSAHGKFDLTK